MGGSLVIAVGIAMAIFGIVFLLVVGSRQWGPSVRDKGDPERARTVSYTLIGLGVAVIAVGAFVLVR